MAEKKDKSLMDHLRGGIDAVKEGYSSMIEGDTPMETESNNRAIIAGATPLLVGLLTGNTGDAVEIASKGLLQEDQRLQKEQISMMDYLRKQNIAKSKAKAPSSSAGKGIKTVYNKKTGKTETRTHDEIVASPHIYEISSASPSLQGDISGKKLDQRAERGLNNKFMKGEQGENILVTPKGQVTRIGAKESDVTPDTRKYMDKTVENFNKVMDKHNSAEAEAKTAIDSLSKGGDFSKKLAVMKAVKEVETRLSDADREFYINDLSVLRRWGEKLDKEFGRGQIPEHILDDTKRLLKKTLGKIKSAKQKSRSRIYEQSKGRGIDTSYVDKRLGSAGIIDNDEASADNLVEAPSGMSESERLTRIEQLKKELGR